MNSVKAKFRCLEVAQTEYSKNIKMMAVMGDSEENKSFNDYTPIGRLEFSVVNGKPAGEYFTPGKEYYLEMTEAPQH